MTVKLDPYYVTHRWKGAPGQRWIVRHFDALPDLASSFVLDRFRTKKAAEAWIVRMLTRHVADMAIYNDDPNYQELGDRYRRMKAQLDSIQGQ